MEAATYTHTSFQEHQFFQFLGIIALQFQNVLHNPGNNNEYLHKVAAIEILNKAVSGHQTEIDLEIQADRALV